MASWRHTMGQKDARMVVINELGALNIEQVVAACAGDAFCPYHCVCRRRSPALRPQGGYLHQDAVGLPGPGRQEAINAAAPCPPGGHRLPDEVPVDEETGAAALLSVDRAF